MKSIEILGIPIHQTSATQAVDFIFSRLDSQQKTFIATVNPEFIMHAQVDRGFSRVLQKTTLSVPDGIGVLWAASINQYRPRMPFKPLQIGEMLIASLMIAIRTVLNISGNNAPLTERITGVDLSQEIAERCAATGRTLFLLGEKEGVADLAAAKLRQVYPALKISGAYAGQGDQDGDGDTTAQLASHPSDIVLVAYGAPKQEYWIDRNLSRIPQQAAMGVGGTFMYLSGQSKRAPKFIRKIGLEWLYRLISQPWRWQRQLALPRFVAAIIRHKIKSL